MDQSAELPPSNSCSSTMPPLHASHSVAGGPTPPRPPLPARLSAASSLRHGACRRALSRGPPAQPQRTRCSARVAQTPRGMPGAWGGLGRPADALLTSSRCTWTARLTSHSRPASLRRKSPSAGEGPPLAAKRLRRVSCVPQGPPGSAGQHARPWCVTRAVACALGRPPRRSTNTNAVAATQQRACAVGYGL
jgi:hypothetical protein